MNYAPIIIPTLSRIEHLKRCIESLKKNNYASETDLIISVDFPPSDKYRDGYKEVKEYLSNGIEGFADVKLYYQNENLGARDNAMFLVNRVIELGYETFIWTEDDNEFSPCFLEYVNKGLEIFKDDEHVFMVCGYSEPHTMTSTSNNVKEIYTFTPWGYGTWIKKFNAIIEKITIENFTNILNDDEKAGFLAYNRPDMFRYLFEAVVSDPDAKDRLYGWYYNKNRDIAYIDQTIAPIMTLEGCFSVCPIRSLVRNWGIDDHSGITKMSNGEIRYEEQEIDESTSFEYRLLSPLIPEKLMEYKNGDKITWPPAKRAWFLRKIYMIFGKKPVRIIMKLSFYLTRTIDRFMATFGKKNKQSASFDT